MSAIDELLSEAKVAGISIRLDPPDLVLKPAERLTRELEERLKQHKAEIVRYFEHHIPRANSIRTPPQVEPLSGRPARVLLIHLVDIAVIRYKAFWARRTSSLSRSDQLSR